MFLMTVEEFKEEALGLRPVLTDVARRWLGGGDEAEDAVQEVLLKLWVMRDELHSPMAVLARVLVRNHCVDRMRRRRVTVDVSVTDIPDNSAAASVDYARLEHIMSMVDALPAYQQMILRLRHIEGMTMADIAGITGSSEAAVRKALSRARMAVRRTYFGEE